MNRHLVLSFRFLSPWFHGRGDGGNPEWPPSPLRAVQALVAASARAGTLEGLEPALRWLECRGAPLIYASEAAESKVGHRLSVPHNAMDLVARQWARGAEGDEARHRTMKIVRPHRLPEHAEVHYAWSVDDAAPPLQALVDATRGVVALGWGIDLVAGDGAIVGPERLAELAAAMTGWEPRFDGRRALRVPVSGTLADLGRRHAAFLARTSLDEPTLRPPPPVSAFALVPYARSDTPRAIEVAAFLLVQAGSDRFRAFDAARRGMAVAGMLRDAVRRAAVRAGWGEERVSASVLGHGSGDEPRLLLVPVPSIEPRGDGGEAVDAVRRVMVYSTDAGGSEADWAARALGGMDLIDERTGEVVAVLANTSREDRVLRRYVSESTTWATVTPLVLPGHDDPGGVRETLSRDRQGARQAALLLQLQRRREALVRKSLLHAGLTAELASSARVETAETGFLAGVEKAGLYAVPSHLKRSPRVHVKLTWPRKVSGPLCCGRGRYSGLGLFAALE